jgi:phytoene desaturase
VVVTSDLPPPTPTCYPRRPGTGGCSGAGSTGRPSCYLVHLGLTRRLEGQAHHTVHLGRDWKATFEALTRHGGIQLDPSLLVTYPSPEDPDAAPPGHATLFVLEPTANTRAGLDWAESGPRCASGCTPPGRPRLRRPAPRQRRRVVVDPPAWEARG